jgi:hypothetical protein
MIWAWLVSRLIMPFLPWVLAALMALGAAGSLAGYLKGRADANGNCQEASLRAELATMRRDVEAWKAADRIEAMLQAEIEAENRELEEKVTDYERELQKSPKPDCRLSPDDIRGFDGLRGNGKR